MTKVSTRHWFIRVDGAGIRMIALFPMTLHEAREAAWSRFGRHRVEDVRPAGEEEHRS